MQIRIALLHGRVKRAEQVDECLTEERKRNVPQVVVEHGVPPKQPRILSVEGKDEADTEDVETLLAVRVTHVAVLFRERIVESADQFTRLDGDFHLPCDVFIAHIDEEVQTIRLAFEVFEQDFLRLGVRRLHVIDEKLRKV